MDLNPLHAFERCAGLDGGFKHFARRAGLVRSSNNGDVVVLLHHLEIGAVASGGEDDILPEKICGVPFTSTAFTPVTRPDGSRSISVTFMEV